jgi:hypothetical protein
VQGTGRKRIPGKPRQAWPQNLWLPCRPQARRIHP